MRAPAAHQALQQLLARRPAPAACLFLLSRRPLSSSPSRALSFCRSSLALSAVSRHLGAVAAFPVGSRSRGRRRLSDGRGVWAAQVNDPGAIDSPLMQAMEKKLTPALVARSSSAAEMFFFLYSFSFLRLHDFEIKEQLNAEKVAVQDAYGDGRHVSIDVVSSAFEGQSAVNRQRMVYKAIWEELQSTVHAVDQMTTRTPSEAEGDQ